MMIILIRINNIHNSSQACYLSKNAISLTARFGLSWARSGLSWARFGLSWALLGGLAVVIAIYLQKMPFDIFSTLKYYCEPHLWQTLSWRSLGLFKPILNSQTDLPTLKNVLDNNNENKKKQ